MRNVLSKVRWFVFIKKIAVKLSDAKDRLEIASKCSIDCSTMFACKSMYWWDGVIHDDQEFIMFVKTTENKFELLQQEILKIHPYKVPCILKIVASAHTS